MNPTAAESRSNVFNKVLVNPLFSTRELFNIVVGLDRALAISYRHCEVFNLDAYAALH